MLELLRQKGLMPGVEAVGGLTLGADVVATAMLHASAADAASGTASAASRPRVAFVVRKADKAHGLQRRIGGADVAGRRVVAVEDTPNTGGRGLTGGQTRSEAGAEIAAVAVLVHRSEASRQAVEAAGHRYLAADDISELEI